VCALRGEPMSVQTPVVSLAPRVMTAVDTPGTQPRSSRCQRRCAGLAVRGRSARPGRPGMGVPEAREAGALGTGCSWHAQKRPGHAPRWLHAPLRRLCPRSASPPAEIWRGRVRRSPWSSRAVGRRASPRIWGSRR